MYYFSKTLDDDRWLCLAPLTSRLIDCADQEIRDCTGYFLFEQQGKDERPSVRILAQVHTDEAAFELGAMMGLA